MRTAEEELQQAFENEGYSSEYFNAWCITYDTYLPFILNAINIARIEAIKECAEVAKSEWIRWGENMGHTVEKKSILKLIEQVK